MDSQLEQKFIKHLVNDKKLQDDLSNCKTSDEALNVVKKLGYDVSSDEFKDSMAKLESLVSRKKGLLTENDLEMVAGGRQKLFDMPSELLITGLSTDISSAASSAA
jgi:predicted ribosomally synthesized peptide with nif11-like leader